MKKGIIFYLLYFLLGIINNKVAAQSFQEKKIQPYVVKTFFHYAKFYKHSKLLEQLPNSYPKGFEISIAKQTTGNKSWHQLYNYPTVGITLIGLYTGTSSIGNIYLASPFVEIPTIIGKKHKIEIKLCVGLAYATNCYNDSTNSINLAISSKWCISLIGSIHYSYPILPQLSATVGLNILHASNGRLKTPNIGINFPSLSVGCTYYLFKKDKLQIKNTDFIYSKKWLIYGWFSAAIKEIGPVYGEEGRFTGKKYSVYNLSLAIARRVSKRSILSIGIDAFYDNSLTPKIREKLGWQGAGVYLGNSSRCLIGSTIGHDLVLTNRIHIVIQSGIYLYNPYTINPVIYQRYGLRCYLSKKIYLSYFLKTHYTVADNIELAVGIKL